MYTYREFEHCAVITVKNDIAFDIQKEMIYRSAIMDAIKVKRFIG